MGVFCFPAGASLPLHDHPEMVVLSKLLYGSVRKRSYDWVADVPPRSGERKRETTPPSSRRDACYVLAYFVAHPSNGSRPGGDDDDAGGLARVVAADEVLCAPREASVLFPRSGGNMHAFTAVTPCAVLDVLTPPYSEEQGRPSTYFTDISIPSLPGARAHH
jgi:plant cysteine oxidase